MTVSRAINTPEKVSEKTLEIVKEAVRRTGYIPNRLASGFASMSTGQVTVMVPSLSNLVFSDFLDGLASILEPRQMQMVVCNYHYHQDRLASHIVNALGWSPDALVVVGQFPEEAKPFLENRGIPVLEAFELLENPFDCNVGISHEMAGKDMARHLAGLGYKNVFAVSANDGLERRTYERIRGFCSFFCSSGIPVPRSIALPERSSIKSGARVMRQILESPDRPEAVFFANDDMAYGALMACRQMGVDVPKDIGIAGFNGLDLAMQCCPSITTVLVDRKRMGAESAHIILERMASSGERKSIDIGYSIYPGQSTIKK